MAEGAGVPGMVPVERAELATRDMDVLADMVRELVVDHTPSFRCPDPGQAAGLIRSATAQGLNAALFRYQGFAYSAEMSPTSPPMAVTFLRGSGVIATAQEEIRPADGDVFLLPPHQPATATIDQMEAIMLRIPWAAAADLAQHHAGLPAGELRFEAMVPVSPARQRVFARTAQFICGQVTTSGAAGIHPLVLPELTRVAAAAFLETFPNTTMTAGYVPGPGWVAPAAVHRAVVFITENAAQPVTVAEIAAAAGVTGRALREAFLRYFEITPQGFLRRARLERAHADLTAAEPGSGVTVAEVARRWGWAGSSQFSAAYRQRFGVTPGRTLRG
ncbi:helix-turn-helix transcriptional regulator [Saccharothrix syringae]|uniref:AraC family transcriptional regulator n=1 Tax=Saccharothrix syringae TaxID=103733 RepID=A0A5Q0GWU3_SACSY|nr:AraC family transcriptional regulator [Saccharothrix syringae]QFZ17994.1 AraC family transcriptional regulator [Saccharothrix syringae]